MHNCFANHSTLPGKDCTASMKQQDQHLVSAWSENMDFTWWIEYLQKGRTSENEPFTFVQVGSFGPQFDAVSPFVKAHPNWRGLILEASPSNKQMLDKYFEKEIHQGRIVTKQNVVTDRCPEQELKFYVTASQEDLPSDSWVRGIGQMASDRLAQDASNWCWHSVPCALLRETVHAELPKAAGWIEADGVDWLQLDAESFEYEILTGFQFSVRPHLIRFEMIKEGERNAEQLLNLLWYNGYVTAGKGDVLAVRRDVAEVALNIQQDKQLSFLEFDHLALTTAFPSPALSQKNKRIVEQIPGCANYNKN